MTITTAVGWEAIGQHRDLCGHRVFTIDAPSIGDELHEPLLILHGFPTSSFDFTAVLDPLRRGRRVLLLDGLGYGLSAKPDLPYTLALQADRWWRTWMGAERMILEYCKYLAVLTREAILSLGPRAPAHAAPTAR